MLDEHSVLTVHGDEILRLHKAEYHLVLLLRGVAGNMQIGVAVIYDLRPLVEKLVNDAAYHILIAGDGGCGNNDPVASIDGYLLMLRKRHTVERGHGLTLTAGGNDDDLVLRKLVELVDIHHHVVGDVHIRKHRGHAQDILHAAPGYADLAAVF